MKKPSFLKWTGTKEKWVWWVSEHRVCSDLWCEQICKRRNV